MNEVEILLDKLYSNDSNPAKTTVCKCIQPNIVIDHDYGMYVCQDCGIVIDYESVLNKNDLCKRQYQGYSKIRHFVNKINWLRGYKSMRDNTRDIVVNKIKQKTTDYSLQAIRRVMNQEGLKQYINYVFYIYTLLNNKSLIIITRTEEDILKKLFVMIERQYIIQCKRPNMFMIEFILFHLLKLIKREEVSKYMKTYKNKRIYEIHTLELNKILNNIDLSCLKNI